MIARKLLGQGRRVRIMVRPKSSYQSLVDAGAEAVPGDLKDPATLEKALTGVSVVVTTANSALRGGEDTVESVDLEGNRRLIDAAKRAEVKRFIFVSALGAVPGHPVPFFDAKGRTEAYLRQSGIPFTIIAPNLYLEVWVGMAVGAAVAAKRTVELVGEGKRRHSFISMNDVATFVVQSIDHTAAVDQYLPLGGPEPLSWREVIATYERVLGEAVPVTWLSAGSPITGLPKMMSDTLAALETFDSVVDSSELARTMGVRQTTLEESLRTQLPPRS